MKNYYFFILKEMVVEVINVYFDVVFINFYLMFEEEGCFNSGVKVVEQELIFENYMVILDVLKSYDYIFY